MNTKEAIEHIKHKYVAYDDEYCAGTEEINKLYKQQDEVIEVLQRGEKFEKIVFEMQGYHVEIRVVRNIEDDRMFIRDMPAGLRISFRDKEKLIDIANHYLCEYEKYHKVIQKYFPKK